MDPRVRWQTLQAHLSAARFAIKMGDLERARQEVETALSIDPEFLAARVMKDQLNAPATPTVPPPPAASPDARPPAASLAASTAKLAQFEQRMKQKLAARTASPDRQASSFEPQAASFEPQAASPEPRVASRQPRVPKPSSSSSKRLRMGAVAAAGIAFAVAMSSNARIREPRFLYAHSTAATGSLVDAAFPAPLDFSLAVDDRTTDVEAPPPFERPLPVQLTVQLPREVPVRVPVTTPVSPSEIPVIATPIPVQAAPVSSVVTDSPPPAVMPRLADDRALVEDALSRYRRAYNRLDARSAQAVYPAVNASALAHAFDGLQSQSLQFDECEIDVRGALANVTCRGTSRYVPKIGNRDPHVEPRIWDFTLRKDEGDWKIENARAGR